jgi:hypothetical protein
MDTKGSFFLSSDIINYFEYIEGKSGTCHKKSLWHLAFQEPFDQLVESSFFRKTAILPIGIINIQEKYFSAR